MASADWASLPSDLIKRIADCFLATSDVDYYMDFRAVCGNWRSATDDPKNSSEPRFRPRRWIIVDEVIQSDARLLMNTTTGRVLRKDLPLLRNYYVITTTPGGFFVLADRKSPHAACVLNPFTGYLIRFMAPVSSEMFVAAAVLSGGSSPTLVMIRDRSYKQYGADPDSECFTVYGNMNTYPFIRLAVTGGMAADGEHGSVALLPVAMANKILGLMKFFEVDPSQMFSDYHMQYFADLNCCFLVEFGGEVLIIFKLQQHMEVFKMDTDGEVLEPVKSIGDHAIFVGYRRCLSVRADKFPSINANSIYYVKYEDDFDIYMYDLKGDKEERISRAIGSLNPFMLCFADPPFTIIQLLSSYTINVRESQLAMEKMFQGLPDVIPYVDYDFSDLDFDDNEFYD